MSVVPAIVSEFPDSIVADCVPASGVMLANKVTRNRYPATIAEREALQNAMGTQDVGADAAELSAGMKARYGLTLPPSSGWSTIAAALADESKGAALFGKYPELPLHIRQHGLQPSFTGGHCIYAQGVGGGLVIVGDPLATSMLPGVSVSELQAFCLSFAGMAVIGKEEPATFVGYRLRVTNSGPFTFFHVVRFTHVLYGPVTHAYNAGSWTPVVHGAPGFWMATAGANKGLYAKYGKSQAFTVQALYSDGSLKPVNAAS